MVYHINFSPRNDYYTTTMNCNLIIANDYSDVTQDIKDLSEKSRLLLEKSPVYQFKAICNRQYLIPIIQTASGPYIQNSITFYTCIKDLRPPNTITSQCVHMRTYTIPKTYLHKLKQDHKKFTFVSFDEWWYGHSSQTIRWNKNDLAHGRYYNFPDFGLKG